MKPLGLRDIIGPVMVGPSSSHTAGALRIAQMVRGLLDGEPTRAEITLYGSFAHTYRGHGTDKALVAGLLGLHTDDLRIRDSFELASERGLDFRIVPDTKTKPPHPNCVDITASDEHGNTVDARGISVGGGAAQLTRIDGIDVSITGEFNALLVHQIDTPGVLAHIAQTMGKRGVNIGTTIMHRAQRGGEAFTVLEIDDPVPQEAIDEVLEHPSIISLRFIPADGLNRPLSDADPRSASTADLDTFESLDFATAADLLAFCTHRDIAISEAFRLREEALLRSKGEKADTWKAYLIRVLSVMRASVDQPILHPTSSMGGLIGGEAQRVHELHEQSAGILGDVMSAATTFALAVLETNASMGRIVAAPTAGSSGVIPAVLLSLASKRNFTDEQLKKALLNCAAVGMIIARNATVSGAEGACQAEIGSASAMAASAACELAGADPRTCLDAAGIALANQLGLICDPIGGLVEAPCQARNAAAAANALVSAEMALSGSNSLAPFDEVVDAMLRVGRSLPFELRETALGGMAACPSCKARFEKY